MLNGLNYPKGPLAWARALGAARVCDVLEGLYRYYGDPRYRLSPYLDRLRHEQQTEEL
jgi:3-hydroxybutyryl-CoA dehydrogenase